MALRSRPVRLAAAILIAAFNAALLAAYVWSRGGQQTHVRVEARGDEFTAYIDGRWMMSARLDAPASGGVALLLEDASGTPSLPEQLVERVRVTDLDTGAVLLDDGFDGGDASDRWTYTMGRIEQRGGALHFRDDSGLSFARTVAWRDYAVDVDLRNVQGGSIVLRTDAAGSGVTYQFVVFRHLLQSFALTAPGSAAAPVRGGPVEPGKLPMVRSMVAMLLDPYPWAIAAMATAAAVAMLAGLADRALRVVERAARRWAPVERASSEWAWYAAEFVCLAAGATAALLIDRYTARAPNWPDSVAYVFQSKIFASGRLAAHAPPIVDSFDYFYPPLAVVHGDRWASIFPFGQALMLAPAERFGASWLVPPLLGAAAVALLFAIGRRWFGAGTALLAAIVLASSPFFLMQSSNYMSHVSALFFLLGAIAAIVLPRARPALSGLVAGLAFGLLFNTRPLTALVLVPSFTALLLAPALDRDCRPGALRRFAGFLAGGLVMLLAYGVYNWGTTGDPLTNNYFSSNQVRLGFGGAHSVSAGIQNDQVQLAYLLLVLHGWPTYVGLALVIAPFALGTGNRWDWFCLLSALAIIISYTTFSENGIMQGPRLWYETVPFLVLLTARSVEVFAERLAQLARRVWRDADVQRAARGAVRLLGSAMVLSLCGAAVWGWLLGRHVSWDVEYVPGRAKAMRDFNGIDARLQRIADAERLSNALVLVDPCAQWLCYGNVFWRNDPGLDGRIIWAKSVDTRNLDLMRAFPDREVWRANYDAAYIVPWGTDVARGLPRVAPGSHAPLARDIVAAFQSGASP